MHRYLVTFDLHKAEQPPGDLYISIYKDIEREFGKTNFCKDFGQFCIVRSTQSVAYVKDVVKPIIDRRSNRFREMDLVVFSVGHEISISRGRREEELRDFRKFFVSGRNLLAAPVIFRKK